MAGTGRGRIGEFALIERYFRPLATDRGAFRLLDDVASLRPRAGDDLILTADLVAAGIHFFPDDPPDAVAKKALRVNLSDLAAKGAEPVGYLLAMALPSDWTEEWLARFVRGLAADQKRYGVSLLGGDTSSAAGGLTISITAIGRLPKGKVVRRQGARPGDLVFVSGTVGDAALGLRLRLGSIDGGPAGRGTARLHRRYLLPEPRTVLAQAVRRYASAALDVSDGLVGDLGHICEVSGVGAEISAAAIPLSRPARALVATDPGAMATVLTGGDDYEILCTVAKRSAGAFARAAASAGVDVTEIGRITAGKGPPVVVGPDGAPLALGARSFDHFSRG